MLSFKGQIQVEKAGDLLDRYTVLLDLYDKLEDVSLEICRALEDGQFVVGVVDNLKKKKMLVERIGEESQTIAALKNSILGNDTLSEDDREHVREAEGILTEAVNRVVAQGNKSFELMAKQGVKVTRR